MQDIKLYSVAEAAANLGCSKPHVYRLIAAGELKIIDIATPGANRTKNRIGSEDLVAYIERHSAS